MSTVVELVKRVSENIADFERELATLSASMERTGATLERVGRNLSLGVTIPLMRPRNEGREKYLRRYRSKGIAMRRRAQGKRA